MALRRRLSPGLPLSDVVLHSYYSTFHLTPTLQEGPSALRKRCDVMRTAPVARGSDHNLLPFPGAFIVDIVPLVVHTGSQ